MRQGNSKLRVNDKVEVIAGKDKGRVGKVFVRGEIWDARLVGDGPAVALAPGAEVVIDGVEEFTLLVSLATKSPTS